MRLGIGLFLLSVLAIYGCRTSQTDLFPMKVGETISYSVRNARRGYVSSVRVSRPIGIVGGSGFELRSNLGSSRLAWQHNRLVAAEMGGTFFDPPLPLIDLNGLGKPERWEGFASAQLSTVKASGILTQKWMKRGVGGADAPTLSTTLTLRWGSHETVVTSRFEEGVGLLDQEERTDGVEDSALSLQAGP